jgi:lipoprotein-anchoring transpeptidase ErfK/SrfK
MRSVRTLAFAISAIVLASAAAADPAIVVAAAEPSSIATGGPQPVTEQPQVTDKALVPAADSASATPGDAASAPPLEPPKPTLFADIDLATQAMTVSDVSGELYRWPISSARAGYTTPTGTFMVSWTSRMHYSRQYDWAPMPFAVFFKDGVAVHATNAVADLGRPASHGCVRLALNNARTFYGLVERHGMALTQITVRGKPPYSPAVAQRRYQQPVFKPFGGIFGYEPPAYQQPNYQPRQRPRGRQVYGGNW